MSLWIDPNRNGVSTDPNVYRKEDAGWLHIDERVVRCMLAEARRFYPTEALGDLWGHWSDGPITIELAGFGGPKAEHTLWDCGYDEEWADRWSDRMGNRGFVNWGCWHSHPRMGVAVPSQGDVEGYWMDEAQTDRSQGWKEREGAYWHGKGHFEAIVADRNIRFWYIKGKEIRLVRDLPFGILDNHPRRTA